MWIFDATPLIYLAKTDHLDLVATLEEPCVIPERVYEEVVETGLAEGYPDARRVERSVEADTFEIVSVTATPLLDRLQENPRLSAADAAVLAHADAHDAVAVMDETYGRDVAASEGITTRGTAYLILHLVSPQHLDAETARTILDAMLDAGWYCAPDTYAKLLQHLDARTTDATE